jgi:hypothetical protein
MEKEIKLRDMRHKEKFQIDDAYLNGYAKKCGIYATGVYVSLCRHSNNDQNCFPSAATIAKELDMSEKQVYRSIKILEDHNIIMRERVGKKLNNLYFLVDKSQWSDRTSSPITTDSRSHHYRTDSPTKDTHIKDTHKRNIEFKFLEDSEFNKTFADFQLMRKSIKKSLTPRAEEIILKKLHQHNLRVAIRMLENSIEHSWQSVFPLKAEEISNMNMPIYKTFKEPNPEGLRRYNDMKRPLLNSIGKI